MSKKQTQEAIVVMQEWLVGEQIECRPIGAKAPWVTIDHPSWDWRTTEYRVKPARWQDVLADIDELAEVKDEKAN